MNYQTIQLENIPPGDRAGFIRFLCASVSVLWKDWPKPMICTVLNLQGNQFSLSGICPHCDSKAVFIVVTGTYTEERPDLTLVCAGMQCQGCKRFILGLVSRHRLHPPHDDVLIYVAHYPLGSPNDSVDPSVPDDIRFDFSEALRSLWVRAFKAAIIMCGRALQTSCDDLGATGASLYEQIDDLAKKGTITEPLRQWAHTVRLSRNKKAHDKAATVISAEEREKQLENDAEAIVAFTREYFHHVYVLPEKLRAYTAPKALPGAS